MKNEESNPQIFILQSSFLLLTSFHENFLVRYFEWFIDRKNFWSQRRTLSTGLIALFSAAGVMVGTWLLIFVLSAKNCFEQEVKRQLIGKDAHIELTQSQFHPVG